MNETKHYFGCEVTVSYEKTFGLWYFDIKHNGATHHYRGIPNKCYTKASALKRAWYRAKWLNDGTHGKRYTMVV